MLTTPLRAPSEARCRVAAAYASKSIPSSSASTLGPFALSFLTPFFFFFFFLVFFAFLVSSSEVSRDFFCFLGFGAGFTSFGVSADALAFRFLFFSLDFLSDFSVFSVFSFFFFFSFIGFTLSFDTFSFIGFAFSLPPIPAESSFGFESLTVELKGFPLVLNVFKYSRLLRTVSLMARRRLFPRSRTRNCLLSANVSGTSVIRLSLRRSSFSPCIIDKSGITRI
mmetsp:Transcript_7744/g.15144  ORF Transcript_7744/g.15144 Transcript_7744/m.15144 type:complete len:224 (+) Transcript_7744:322-993(+)